MIFNRSALSHFLNLQGISNAKIAEDLTDLGFETDILQDLEKLHDGLKIAQIISFQKVSQKNYFFVEITSQSNQHKVICGADNFAAGDFVIWAPPGSIVNFQKMKTKQFGSFTSEGMLCSSAELKILNIPDQGIIILPAIKETKLAFQNPNNQNVLTLLNLNEASFQTELHFGNPESKSIYGLALYLSRKCNLSWKNSFSLPSQSVDSNKIAEYLIIKNNQELKLPSQFVNLAKENKLNFDDLKTFANFYFQYFFNIKVSIYSLSTFNLLDKEKDLKKKLQAFSSKLLFHCLVFTNENKSEIPDATTYHFAAKNFMQILQHEKKNPEMNLLSYKFFPRHSDLLEINPNFLQSMISSDWDLATIEKYLQIAGFAFRKLNANKWKLTCPNWQKFNFLGDVAEEIIKFYGIEKLKPAKFNPTVSYGVDFISAELKIRDLLLYKGFSEAKTMLVDDFLQKQDSSPNLLTKIRSSIVPQLRDLSFKLQKNFFTLDTVLHQKETIQIKKVLTVLAVNPLVNWSFYSVNEISERTMFVSLIKNIFQSFSIPISGICKENQTFAKSKPSWTNQLKKILTHSFIEIRNEKIFYQTNPIGNWGQIVESQDQKYFSHYYLELDWEKITTLLNKSKIKFQPLISQNLIFRDFSFQFENSVFDWVNVSLKDNIKIEKQFLNFLLLKIQNMYFDIIKIKVLEVYQTKKVTIRIWLKKEKNQSEQETFLSLEKKINQIKF